MINFSPMKFTRKGIIIVILLVLCFLLHFYSMSESRVENGYSNGIFIHISSFLRLVTGIIPFSIGDLFYGLLAGWLIWQLIKFFKFFFKKERGVSGKALYKDVFYNDEVNVIMGGGTRSIYSYILGEFR